MDTGGIPLFMTNTRTAKVHCTSRLAQQNKTAISQTMEMDIAAGARFLRLSTQRNNSRLLKGCYLLRRLRFDFYFTFYLLQVEEIWHVNRQKKNNEKNNDQQLM